MVTSHTDPSVYGAVLPPTAVLVDEVLVVVCAEQMPVNAQASATPTNKLVFFMAHAFTWAARLRQVEKTATLVFSKAVT